MATITAPREKLAAALAAAARAIPARPVNLVYAGVTLQTVTVDERSVLVVTGGDGENWIKTRLAVTADEDVTVIVSGVLLADLVKDLPGEQVELEVTDETLNIKLAKGGYTIPRMSEVPVYATAVDNRKGSVDGAAFADAVAKVLFAASKNEAVPALTAVRVEVDGDQMTLAATDRYRLATATIPFTAVEDEVTFNLNMPTKQLADVVRLLAKSETVHVSVEDGSVAFGSDETAVHSRLVAGEYPNWRALLNITPENWIEVNAAELIAPIKRSARFSPDVVALTFSADDVEVSGENSGMGSGSETVASKTEPAIDADPVTVRINPVNILDGLSSIKSSTVRIGISGPTKAVLVTGDAGHTYLTMPRR